MPLLSESGTCKTVFHPRPDSGLGFQVKVRKPLKFIALSLESGLRTPESFDWCLSMMVKLVTWPYLSTSTSSWFYVVCGSCVCSVRDPHFSTQHTKEFPHAKTLVYPKKSPKRRGIGVSIPHVPEHNFEKVWYRWGAAHAPSTHRDPKGSCG